MRPIFGPYDSRQFSSSANLVPNQCKRGRILEYRWTSSTRSRFAKGAHRFVADSYSTRRLIFRTTTVSINRQNSSPSAISGQHSPSEADRYEFLEEIARGSAAVDWRVRDRHLQRQSAIKYLIDSQDNREMRSRLRRDARICAKLVHPGIVPIHELSNFEDGRPFVCMKLIEGKAGCSDQRLTAELRTRFNQLRETIDNL